MILQKLETYPKVYLYKLHTFEGFFQPGNLCFHSSLTSAKVTSKWLFFVSIFSEEARLKTLVFTVTWLQKSILACPTKSKQTRQKSMAALLLDIVVLKNILPSHDMKISLCNRRIEQELLDLQKSVDIWNDKFPESFRDQFEDEAQQVKQVKVLTQNFIEIWKHMCC